MFIRYLWGYKRLLLTGVIAGFCLLAPPTGALAMEEMGKDMGKFERALQDNFPGSYKLYMDLNGEDKTEVFREFKKTNPQEGVARFATVIAKILKLSIDQASHSQHQSAAPAAADMHHGAHPQ